jgi:hypothetical protein
MKKEKDLTKKLREKTPTILWNRIENLAIAGMPDLLGYNKNGRFFTVENKLTKVNSIAFRPHQIAWHVQHPTNAFILVFSNKHRTTKLFKSTSIHDLVKDGFEAPNHVAMTWDEISTTLQSI